MNTNDKKYNQKYNEDISINEVEVINSSRNPEKITKIRVDDDNQNSKSSHSSGTESFEEFFEQMKNNSGNNAGGIPENNPIIQMMGNISEIKKIKVYFFIALIAGFWSLWGLTMFMAPISLVFGFLDLIKGSKLTEKASYIGMIFATIALMMEYNLF